MAGGKRDEQAHPSSGYDRPSNGYDRVQEEETDHINVEMPNIGEEQALQHPSPNGNARGQEEEPDHTNPGMLNMDLSNGSAGRQEEDAGSATTIQRILAYGKLKAILIGISVLIVCGIFGLGTLVPLYRQQDAIKCIPVTCPSHWIGYEGYCYHFSKEAKTFNESQNFCRLHNASLAKISKEDMEFVTNITRNEVYWIDLIKKATQPWKWGDGETATLKVWGDGGDCAYLNDDGTANSGRCINKHRFICQKSIL